MLNDGLCGDFRGTEMAAGVQPHEISDHRETECASLNMDARCPTAEVSDFQKRRRFIPRRQELSTMAGIGQRRQG